ncbi:hypothetical protein LCGC14_2806870, partial [marine sediment metagenome]
MGWIDYGSKRVIITIDSSLIDETLTDFPVLLYISADSGIDSDDVSFVFDELTADANRLKIAVTSSDGVTELYTEIEKWDDANEKAWLWVKVPSISSTKDTVLYLYYDIRASDNRAYVGDVNSFAGEKVWDDNFMLVSHMQDDPDTSNTRDSTSNNNDGAKTDANEPLQATSKIGQGQLFDGINDLIAITNAASLNAPTASNRLTLEIIIHHTAWGTSQETVLSKDYRQYELRVNTAAPHHFNAYLGNGTNYDDYSSGYGLALNTYYLLQIVVDGTNVMMYVNGDLKSTTGQG